MSIHNYLYGSGINHTKIKKKKKYMFWLSDVEFMYTM